MGYADGVTLISPSLRALNNMISICEKFASVYHVAFNAEKTMCIKFGCPVTDIDKVYLNGSIVKWVDCVKHLGNIVNNRLKNDDDCSLKKSIFIGNVNQLMGNYGKLPPGNLCYLFISYCCTLYGSQLWDFNSHGFKSICTPWNKAVRTIMNLHYINRSSNQSVSFISAVICEGTSFHKFDVKQ